MASKKLYEALAERFRPNVFKAYAMSSDDTIAGLEMAIQIVADTFVADNPRFDRKHFLSACGLPTKE